MGRLVYHVDFGDGVNAGDVKAHSNFNRALYRRERFGDESVFSYASAQIAAVVLRLLVHNNYHVHTASALAQELIYGSSIV